MKRTALTVFAAALFASAALAQEAETRLQTWTGGIGQAERDIITENEKNYTLKIVFTGDVGMFVANVRVVIKDKNGAEVVNLLTQGPVLLADLPPGRYTVETNAEGNEKNFKVTLHDKLTIQHVRFPIKDEPSV